LRENQTEQQLFNFERLEVWARAVELAGNVYVLTRAFPADERFGLTNQMRRAAVSVSSNVAEGASRSSRVDFARFVEVAAGSLYELVSQAIIAKREGWLTEEAHEQLRSDAANISRMLSGLRKSLTQGGPP